MSGLLRGVNAHPRRPALRGPILIVLGLILFSAAACSGGLPEPGQGGADPDGPIATPTPAIDRNLLAPDLQTLPPFKLSLQSTLEGGRELRFGTTIVNLGQGPLDLLGQPDSAGRTVVTQRIARIDGGISARQVGNFILHPTHEHWHFEDFMEFELWSYAPGGRLEQRLVTSGKLTFCIFDTETIEPAAAKAAAFSECGNEAQGISVGWGDTYDAPVPGQALDVSDIADGRYALRMIADPDDRLLELDETNNANVAYIEIAWPVVELREGP
ncbi:MAG: hypothetical protein GEU75_03085 [Dehalococcoidia bacterium]|nr:hypothetical protein [Dehalococcoidia bacterium]